MSRATPAFASAGFWNARRLPGASPTGCVRWRRRGYVDVSFVPTPIHEELLGDYEAQGVRLVFVDDRVLRLVPVGRHVLGADGRIDVMSINTCLAMLIRRDGEWCFARREERTGPPLTWRFNRDTFHDFLVEFVR